MDSTEKAKLFNDTLHSIEDMLEKVEDNLDINDCLKILSTLIKNYDLDTAANLVEHNYEPYLTKGYLEDRFFDEGNEESGYMELSTILETVEKIINCDDYSNDIKFSSFIRLETDEEKEENEHSQSVEWFTTDDSIDFNKYIQFNEA